MNGRERIATVMKHGIPDRVPVMCQLSLGHYFLNVDLPPPRIWFTSEGFAEALIALRERYDFDGILINMPGRDPKWLHQVASIERCVEGEHIYWKNGSRTTVPRNDNLLHDSPGTGRAGFERFDPAMDLDTVHHWPGYTWGIYHTPYITGVGPGLLLEPPEYFGRTIDLVRQTVGEAISVHGEVFSPFTYFFELFGYQEALMALAVDPAKATAILEHLTGASIAWARLQAERGVDAILISSAFAGAGYISAAMYKEFVVPHERMLVDAVHADFPDVPVYTHTCGRLGDRLELLVETGTDGVDTLDPPPLGDTELIDAKARIGERLFIKGNMNSVALLTDNETQVRDRARSALEAGMSGGGYILSTACSVAPGVEPWKLEMFVGLAEEYGRY